MERQIEHRLQQGFSRIVQTARWKPEHKKMRVRPSEQRASSTNRSIEWSVAGIVAVAAAGAGVVLYLRRQRNRRRGSEMSEGTVVRDITSVETDLQHVEPDPGEEVSRPRPVSRKTDRESEPVQPIESDVIVTESIGIPVVSAESSDRGDTTRL